MNNWEKYFGTPAKAALMEVQAQNRYSPDLINVWRWERTSDGTWTCGLIAYGMSADGYLDWLESEADHD